MCRQKQLDLNKALFAAVEKGDFGETERLLKLGADPLGSTDECNPKEHLLGELFCRMEDDEALSSAMPAFLQLFYTYGMDIAAQDIPENDEEQVHPLWQLAFCTTEDGLRVLHTMLEHGLDYVSAEILVEHILLDMEMCDGCDIEDIWSKDHFTCGLKMVMLAASYPNVVERSAYIRECVDMERNDIRNLSKFCNWNQFDYQIDLSTCTNIPHGLQNATLRIQDKNNGEYVWTLSI